MNPFDALHGAAAGPDYTLYVVAAYASTIAILGALILSSIIASRRARAALASSERTAKA